jgi:hypothetical protein
MAWNVLLPQTNYANPFVIERDSSDSYYCNFLFEDINGNEIDFWIKDIDSKEIVLFPEKLPTGVTKYYLKPHPLNRNYGRGNEPATIPGRYKYTVPVFDQQKSTANYEGLNVVVGTEELPITKPTVTEFDKYEINIDSSSFSGLLHYRLKIQLGTATIGVSEFDKFEIVVNNPEVTVEKPQLLLQF